VLTIGSMLTKDAKEKGVLGYIHERRTRFFGGTKESTNGREGP